MKLGSMAAWALALTFAVEAGATPIPRVETGEDGRLRLAKRREAPHPPWPTPYALDPITSTDVLTTDLALDLDPASGALSGQLTVELQAKQAGVSSFLLYFAADLAVTGASSDGPAVNLSSNV
ncbi:MAG: hypothetical protein KC731_30495 [Myxococcales bacterium]|nr:hypothetical protein [Myxococcales bacterium]